MTAIRKCSKCPHWFPATTSHFQRNGSGLRPECRQCLKTIREDREFARREANFPEPPPVGSQACACCNVIPNHVLQFDHTGTGKGAQFRGWCCRPCNQFLLAFTDQLYFKAIAYKKRHATPPATRGAPRASGSTRNTPATPCRVSASHPANPRRSARIAQSVTTAGDSQTAAVQSVSVSL